MVIKGSTRGHTRQNVLALAKHLCNERDNDRVELVGTFGVLSENVAEALEEMRMLSLGTRTRKSLYHASINIAEDEAANFDEKKWLICVDELESRLGLTGHQRCVIKH